MAYQEIPLALTTHPGEIKTEQIAHDFLIDISNRKEFRITSTDAVKVTALVNNTIHTLSLNGLVLHGHQHFLSNYINPYTPYSRILVFWQPGTGKTLAAITVAKFHIDICKKINVEPRVFILGFTKDIFIEEMLKYPELQFVTMREAQIIKEYKKKLSNNDPGSVEMKTLSGIIGSYKRRITDASRGGYFEFYGYKEITTSLFHVTKKGDFHKYDLVNLFETEVNFQEKLEEALRLEYIHINTELLHNLKRSLLICDEIHNVYNINKKNNYGMTIKFILDEIDKTSDSGEVSKAIFLSATPLTGNASEIVDLLSMLIPNHLLKKPLTKADFFDQRSEKVSCLKFDALDKIGHLMTGRVTYLLDTDTSAYPKQLMEGEPLDKVPFLKFIKCPMSDLHERTLVKEMEFKEKGLSQKNYTLNDIVFPNPETDEYGLFSSKEIMPTLVGSSSDWQQRKKIAIRSDTTLLSDDRVITGQFLQRKNLATYSTKYATLIDLLYRFIENERGKIMIMHSKVHLSGVLLLQEILKENGFINEVEMPNEHTICSQCGRTRTQHRAKETHDYLPARFIIVHSDIDKQLMLKRIDRFNAPSNTYGQDVLVLIGSKIIQEGYSFKSIRLQLIVSLAKDIATLLQWFGRTSRRTSHAALKPEERTITRMILVSTYSNESLVSPEMQMYVDKMAEYQVIQKILKQMSTYAVDIALNYEKISSTFHSETDTELQTLPFKPKIAKTKLDKEVVDSTYEAFGYINNEIHTIEKIVEYLLTLYSVWQIDQLWTYIKNGVVFTGYNSQYFNYDNFLVALENLAKSKQNMTRVIYRVGPKYLIASYLNPVDLRPDLDVGSYLYVPHRMPRSVQIRTSTVADVSRYTVDLDALEKVSRLMFIEHNSDFHYAVLKQLVENTKRLKLRAELLDLYTRWRMLVFDDKKLIGYYTKHNVEIFDGRKWHSGALRDHHPYTNHQENPVVVGMVMDNDISTKRPLFKIRPPITNDDEHNSTPNDRRNIIRGAVCTTRPRSDLVSIYNKLFGNSDGKAMPTQQLCNKIIRYLLKEEETARSDKNGLRWVYLFNDT